MNSGVTFGEPMKAIAHDGYGPPDDLALREVAKPSIDDTGVLIRVRAAAVNPVDWHLMRGEPSFLRMMGGSHPVGRIPGSDVAGQVEAVGARVTAFRPGDEVLACAVVLWPNGHAAARRILC